MEWISVKKELPKESGRYLIYAPSMDKDKPFIDVAWYETFVSADNVPAISWHGIPNVWSDVVTHWMPLPDKPNGH